jgi:hypothetical protein
VVAVAAAAALTIGAVAIFTGGEPSQSVDVAGDPGTASTLTWTAIDVDEGLGWSHADLTTGDGTIYGLSTAPGPQSKDQPLNRPSTLYRSSDGQTWETVEVPGGMSPTALASSDDHLYAVGTSASGGTINIVLATSDDGAASWDEASIPAPAAALKARFPGEVQLSAPRITHGPNGVLAAVTVAAYPNVERLLPGVSFPNGWQINGDGVDIFAVQNGEQVKPAPIAEHRTWDELGLEPELRALVGGEVHLYSSTNGSTFEEIDASGVSGNYLGGLIGSADGYRMLVGRDAAVHQLWSADGRSWSSTGPDLEGWVQTVGLLRGTPTAVIGTQRGASLLTATSGGGWAVTDLFAASGVPNPGGQVWLQTAAIGPLGLVGVVGTGDGEHAATSVIESADGRTFTSHSLEDLGADATSMVGGIAMNADAVTLRILPSGRTDASDKRVPLGPQRLLVGVPS